MRVRVCVCVCKRRGRVLCVANCSAAATKFAGDFRLCAAYRIRYSDFSQRRVGLSFESDQMQSFAAQKCTCK